MKKLTKEAKVISFFTNVSTSGVDIGGKIVILQGKKNGSVFQKAEIVAKVQRSLRSEDQSTFEDGFKIKQLLNPVKPSEHKTTLCAVMNSEGHQGIILNRPGPTCSHGTTIQQLPISLSLSSPSSSFVSLFSFYQNLSNGCGYSFLFLQPRLRGQGRKYLSNV